MPRRNRAQQDKHNESRRQFVRKGKKAIFCLKHLENTHPGIVKESYKMYEYLHGLYPNKRDLTKTEIYQKYLKNKGKSTEVEPVLAIPLIQKKKQQTSTTATTKTAQVQEEEIPLQIPVLTDEETSTLIRDLQNDPDLSYFNNKVLNQVTVPTERTGVAANESDVFMPFQKTEVVLEACEHELDVFMPRSVEEEIDRIIQQEFDMLGNDLPDLICNDDELMC